MASGRDDGNARWEYYNAVMHWMSKDSKRQWTHRINRTLQRNLRIFPLFYFWTCAK